MPYKPKIYHTVLYSWLLKVFYKLLIVTVIAMGDAVVKIDEDLLNRVKKLIKNKPKKYRYRTKRQFMDIAVLELLDKEEKKIEVEKHE